MNRRYLTYAEKNHLLDLVQSYDYAMTESDLARYILLNDDEPFVVDLAHYFIDFPEGGENA